MKFTIKREALDAAVTSVMGAIHKITTIPILSCVRLSAGDGRVVVTATDMDVTIMATARAEVIEAGAVAVGAATLGRIAERLPAFATVTIEKQPDKKMRIESGRTQFELTTLPVEDWPELKLPEYMHEFSVPAAALALMIKRVQPAICDEETRYYLNGVYLQIAGTDDAPLLRMVATDGHRLVRTDTSLPRADGIPVAGAADGDMSGIIVPRRTIKVLSKLALPGNGAVAVSVDKTYVRFAVGDVVVISKTIDATYVDYDRVIPTEFAAEFEVGAEELTAAIKCAEAIDPDRSHLVKLTTSKGRLTVSASTPDGDTATEKIDIDHDGDQFEIGFNAHSLLDVLYQIKSLQVQIGVQKDSFSPVVFWSPGDDKSLFVVMPMKV